MLTYGLLLGKISFQEAKVAKFSEKDMIFGIDYEGKGENDHKN